MTANEIPPHLITLASEARDLIAQGDGINSVISYVHERSGGLIGTLWAIGQALGIRLPVTRDLVELSPALNSGYDPPESWRDLVTSLGLH
ncbi:MAG TPA: hypothetical protein VFW21_11980 [Mycobacterium sp.]|nr:hypothetical protein [Mycobacterium sp.]